MKKAATKKDMHNELEELRQQLDEANETIDAIRTGQIDALVVENEDGHQLFTLKTADQAYRIFIEKMKEGAVTVNDNNLIVYCNSQFASMLSFPLTRVIGLPLADFIAPEDRDAFDLLITKGWTAESRGELSLKDNTERRIPCIISTIAVEVHEGMELSIVFTDLTIQKEAERQLQLKNTELEAARREVATMNEELEYLVKERTKDLLQSQEHFKFLADNIPVIVWTTYADGRINYLNKSWYDFSGMDAGTADTQQVNGLIHPDDIEKLKKTWHKAVKEKSKFELEYRVLGSRDGVYRWFLTNAQPYFDEDGSMAAWFGTSTDIEDQKKELQKKDEFIGIASHELKTPLTSLKGYAQLIERHPGLPAPLDQYIRKANESINKLHHLVNDLLDVSKIQAGKLQFTVTQVDLAKLVFNCIENSQHMFPEFDFQSELITGSVIQGNEERLEQVMMNLVNNAVKYSRGIKKVFITITQENGMATVSVRDHGIGLSPADQSKIFDRFYRVEDKLFMTSGLGMGLYISAEIIRSHAGTIYVESKPQQGSVFSFSLPLVNG